MTNEATTTRSVTETRRRMRFVIAGGTGQVGTVLTRAFRTCGDEVVILSRRASASNVVRWDGKTLGAWAEVIDGADVVINLAGHTVNCRYNKTNRARIMSSRTDSTRVIGEAIRLAKRPPGVWLQASTATIYAHRFDAANDEASGVIGGDEPNAPATWRFSIDVAKAWEQALDEAEVPRTRKIEMRSAMVMSPDRGGIFDVLLRLVRFGLGGKAGSGQQFVSWVHYVDFVRAIYWLIDRPDVSGVVNIASPNPLPNEDFMRELRRAWGTRLGLPATRWMLEVGAVFLRTESELILKSRRVVPGRLMDHGFTFEFPTWAQAARDLCAKRRGINADDPRRLFLDNRFSSDRNNRTKCSKWDKG